MVQPFDVHWIALNRVLCYLEGTLLHGFAFYKAYSLHLSSYCVANWVLCSHDQKIN